MSAVAAVMLYAQQVAPPVGAAGADQTTQPPATHNNKRPKRHKATPNANPNVPTDSSAPPTAPKTPVRPSDPTAPTTNPNQTQPQGPGVPKPPAE